MSLPFAFWDTSALIPLCTWQMQTAQARRLYAGFGVVVWWATPVEIISGLTRLERMGEIDHDEFLAGKQQAQALSMIWNSIRPPTSIAAQACSLLELYPLRSADALQLSAAMEYFGHATSQGNVFITADQRLADAARRIGFLVEFI
jgi:predicted nucleic acid-binding protein